ncbi:hypothetical protein M9Y10_032196 [Tritrichomonas musculus]|uniref:Protein kinase domain-containing protein n=1 Tax=Tritrichomonas musculus TaxID=1915356 RepID=A0ABR2GZC8_9EUKA
MNDKFSELRIFFKEQIENISDRFFKDILQKYELLYDSGNRQLSEELSCNNDSKVIVIDETKESNSNPYFIFCCKNKIIIIFQENYLNTQFLTQFFSKNLNLEAYSFKKYTPQIKLINHTLLAEIKNFSSNFIINNGKYIAFWNSLIRCICCILIMNGYQKSKRYHCQITNEEFKELQEESNQSNSSFIKLREIGRGSCGVVDLIYHFREEKILALKIPYDDNNELIERERKNYLRIQFPLIVHYYGYVEIYQRKQLLLEFVEGQTLNSYDTTKLDIKCKYNIIFELLLSFYFIHSNKLIYRDLYLSNIIIDENKDAILIDFDRLISIDEQSTIDFAREIMPPEINTKQKLSYESDIYTLGYIMYYILFDKKPIKIKQNETEFDLSILQANPSEKSLFESCLNANPSKRPNISELIHKFYITFLYKNQSKGQKEKNLIDLYEKSISESSENQELFTLGLVYDQGFYVDHDVKKAIHYYLLAANQNNSEAQFNLGEVYQQENDISKAMHYFSLAANQNNADALFKLGVIYDEGTFITRDINKAIHYYLLASNLNHPDAQCNLGVFYDEGTDIPRDVDKAIRYYSLAADQNHSEAQTNLGFIYHQGLGVRKDINLAIHYYSLAAVQNHPDAQFNLGVIYDEGDEVPRDFKKALYYYSLAAEQKHPKAQFNLGIAYDQGIDVPRDINKAIRYYLGAANQGHSDAQFNLAIIYEYGVDILKDPSKAIYYYYLAAKQGHSIAQYNLGLIYYHGLYVKRDIQKAIYFTSLAADQGYVDAQYNLGIIYRQGIDVPRNINKAIHYYSLAANQNHPQAQNNLGVIYDKGIDIQRDVKKAIYYYTLASKQNYVNAQYNLGAIYEKDKDIPRDVTKSIYYYSLAAKQNNSSAQYNLGFIYYNSIPCDINHALHYFQLAAEQNHKSAQYCIGVIYDEGIHVRHDVNKAIYYYSRAANQNSALALSKLGFIYFKGVDVPKDINKAIYYMSLAAKQNEPRALCFLGIIYEYGFNVQFDINKSIHYFSLASERYHSMSQFFLGSIYFEGIYVDYDINKAIHYFKEASCFNNHYAKNNLGIIYKTGKGVSQNVFGAIEYLKEAISQHNDGVAMFNLAHIYFYEEAGFIDIDKAIELLVKSANEKVEYSIDLLCLAVVKKYPMLDVSEVIKEFEQIDEKSREDLLNEVFHAIISGELDEKNNYDLLYNSLKNINLVYYGLNIENQTEKEKIIKKDKRVEINSVFYEGLGDIDY